ncbi:MAG: hypothetical protein WC284_08485 [Candidimonas sp.]
MAIRVHKTDNTVLVIVPDKTIDTAASSLKLVGRDVLRYGELYAENFISLLENFNNYDAPDNPIEGQLWFKRRPSGATIFENADQLYIRINDEWRSLGPSDYSSSYVVHLRITDTGNIVHSALGFVSNGRLMQIVFYGTSAITPTEITTVETDDSDNPLVDYSSLIATDFPIINVGFNHIAHDIYGREFFGIASSARYADLAERYHADRPYECGTVVKLGGEFEITQTDKFADPSVFGVISTNPAYRMNSDAGNDQTHPYVALQGRVPVKIFGKIKKGDRLVSAGEPGCAQVAPRDSNYDVILGRSLGDKISDGVGIVEMVIGVK